MLVLMVLQRVLLILVIPRENTEEHFSEHSVSIGTHAGSGSGPTPLLPQASKERVNIGWEAGRYSGLTPVGNYGIAIGSNAGKGITTAGQGENSVAIGYYAGHTALGQDCVYVGGVLWSKYAEYKCCWKCGDWKSCM